MDRSEKLIVVSELVAEQLVEGGVGLRIRGGCMAPVLEDGALVTVRRVALPLPGDVVVFRSSSDFVAHRVLGFAPVRGSLGVVTQGDHCSRHDGIVPLDRLLGKVVMRVSLGQRFAAVVAFVRIVYSRVTR